MLLAEEESILQNHALKSSQHFLQPHIGDADLTLSFLQDLA
jgi:hypothetical protein